MRRDKKKCTELYFTQSVNFDENRPNYVFVRLAAFSSEKQEIYRRTDHSWTGAGIRRVRTLERRYEWFVSESVVAAGIEIYTVKTHTTCL